MSDQENQIEENQDVNRQSQALTIPRDENGRWQAGHGSPNPGGFNNQKGLPRWDVLVDMLAEQFPTVRELRTLFTYDEKTCRINLSPEVEGIHPIKVGVLRRFIGQLEGIRTLEEHEAFWDRYQGKSIQTVIYKTNRHDTLPTEFASLEEASAAVENERANM